MSNVSPLLKPLVRPLTRAITEAGVGVFNPVSLFAANEPGYIYDNNDLTSFFADSGGTTAASVNGPVGLQFDKSRGLSIGADVRNLGAVSVSGAGAPAGSYNPITGAFTVTRDAGGNQEIVLFNGLVPDSFYKLTVSVTSAAGQNLSVRAGNSGGVIFVTITGGASATIYCPTNASGQLSLTASTANVICTGTLTSIQSVAGNHRYQLTAASRPTLRGTPTGANLFTAYGTPEAGWVNSGGGVATATATTGNIPTTTVPTAGRVYRVRWTVAVTSGDVRITMGGVTGTTRTASGTYEVYVAATTAAPLTIDGVTSFTGSVSAIDVRDVTADVVTAPYGLQYDGVDDFLQTASVNFTATDSVNVCMGVRKLSDAAQGIAVELSTDTGSNNGSFRITAPGGAAAATYSFTSKGTIQATAVSTGSYPAPISNVITGIADISTDTSTIRVSGTAFSAVTDQGTGNYGNYVIYFGRRGGTSLPLNGLDFGGVCIGRTLSAAELSNTERWVSHRTGVTI